MIIRFNLDFFPGRGGWNPENLGPGGKPFPVKTRQEISCAMKTGHLYVLLTEVNLPFDI